MDNDEIAKILCLKSDTGCLECFVCGTPLKQECRKRVDAIHKLITGVEESARRDERGRIFFKRDLNKAKNLLQEMGGVLNETFENYSKRIGCILLGVPLEVDSLTESPTEPKPEPIDEPMKHIDTIDDSGFECGICRQVFDTGSDLQYHQTKEHGGRKQMKANLQPTPELPEEIDEILRYDMGSRFKILKDTTNSIIRHLKAREKTPCA